MWEVFIELKCKKADVEKICNTLMSHHCIMYAEPLMEGGKDKDNVHTSVIQDKSSAYIMCNAFVLHITDEHALKRYLNKLDGVTVEKFLSQGKNKAFLNHLLKTAGIGATIIFLVILSHETLIGIARNESLELVEIMSIAGIAALVSFIIESVIVWNEHNR